MVSSGLTRIRANDPHRLSRIARVLSTEDPLTRFTATAQDRAAGALFDLEAAMPSVPSTVAAHADVVTIRDAAAVLAQAVIFRVCEEQTLLFPLAMQPPSPERTLGIIDQIGRWQLHQSRIDSVLRIVADATRRLHQTLGDKVDGLCRSVSRMIEVLQVEWCAEVETLFAQCLPQPVLLTAPME